MELCSKISLIVIFPELPNFTLQNGSSEKSTTRGKEIRDELRYLFLNIYLFFSFLFIFYFLVLLLRGHWAFCCMICCVAKFRLRVKKKLLKIIYISRYFAYFYFCIMLSKTFFRQYLMKKIDIFCPKC